jgi:hypothetical protein
LQTLKYYVQVTEEGKKKQARLPNGTKQKREKGRIGVAGGIYVLPVGKREAICLLLGRCGLMPVYVGLPSFSVELDSSLRMMK